MNFKHLSLLLLSIVIPVIIYAQKLPGIQQSSLRAPSNVKIDGKSTEWSNKFQAYNHATDIFYTMANDDDNLYLTIQATEHTNINKILGGGIILTINPSNQKNIKNGISITYPFPDMHNRVWVNLKYQPASQTEADSIMKVKNTDYANASKLIKVTGIKSMDSLISVYNHDGIKAAGAFNNKLFFTYELSISLKQLGLDANAPAKFTYNIKLPGVDMAAVYNAAGQATTLAGGVYVVPIGPLPGVSDEYIKNNQPSFPVKVHIEAFTSSTDFWSEYTLAKK
ncbi:hypothetical protein [Mucilaginibacter rubeus]|uniref:hypothetical protein n=1 Tax=Mucilaginibacter rubeus TaxID=2027860 RepID=UPI00166AC5A8|nr:hypothetical protein [Mucilaginibacter rubeus]GGA94627.1 hypothetical protein GCM10011500_07960 [Mucilaginibacter rubeus]